MQDNIEIPRRDLLKLAVLAGVAGTLPGITRAQEEGSERLLTDRPLPTVDARFPSEMAPGVFILPDKRIPLVPNIGIIVGTDSVLVVDCGLGIDSAENVLNVTRELAPGRQIILTVTHAHPEHGFGAQVFRDEAHIFYNSLQRDYLMRSAQTLLAGFREGVLPPAHVHLLDGIEPTPPHKTYDGAGATIDLGGREVQFRTWGTAHSPGDQVVYLAQEGILFAGDLLEERMFPIVPNFPPMIGAEDIDLTQWEVALNDIMELQPQLIVPGHGNLGGAEIPADILGYFRTVRELTKEASEPVARLETSIRKSYPTWENPEFIQPLLTYLR